MLVGTTGPVSQEVGLQVLKSGGTAADAAIATAMAQICLAAGSWVSFAGIMNVVYYEAASGRSYNMNASYNSVKGETEPETIPTNDLNEGIMNHEHTPVSGRTVLVPGFMKGAESLHERFGKLSMQEIVNPTIHCSEQGFKWNETLENLFQYREQVLTRDPDTKSLFTKSGGTPYKSGDLFRQPKLAATLKQFLRHGADHFYSGEWSEQLLAKVSAAGGKLSKEDLAAYDVVWSDPLATTYADYELLLHGASGGEDLVFAMNMVETAKLSSQGRFDEDAEVLFWISQIARIAPLVRVYGDRVSALLGISNLQQESLAKDTAEKLWPLVQQGKFPTVAAPRSIPAHSDGIVAVDPWGNAIAMVHTINTTFWGTNGMSVGGIPIPDSAAVQPRTIIATPPGERVSDTTTLGLVMNNGRPSMAFAAIGAGSTVRTLSSLVSSLDFSLSPQEVISLPALGRFVQDAQPATVDEFQEKVRTDAEAIGLKLLDKPELLGYWIGIRKNEDGMQGGSLRLQGERNGTVVAY